MSTFQERILAASGSSSSSADTDPELYRYRSASSEEYLESCNYRVWSTELPDRFLVWWMCPVGRDEAEQRSLERELRSDEESPLHIPLEIFMTAYYERYERVKGMASFLSDDCAVGSEDAAAAVEAQLAGDADYRAQAFAFIEGFVCFQQSFSRHGIARASAALLIWLNENVQINLTLPSLIRIFDCVLDTPSRHNQACACFCARLFVSLSSKPDSGRPRSVDDASATDAASGSQKRRSWDSTR